MSHHLHIVCLDAPYPPDCSRSIDTFERISALHQCGIKIHLHCLKNYKQAPIELNSCCEDIKIHNEENIPVIVRNLNENNFPVLIENIYQPSILQSIKVDQRKVVLRIRGKGNWKQKKSLIQKIIPVKLSRHANKNKQSVLPDSFLYACISSDDVSFLKQKYHLPNVEFLPPFVSWQRIKSEPGIGSFCLYHSDLSDNANEKMAGWLVEKIFSEIQFPFVIAGKNPSRRITSLANLYSHICIVANPTKKEIDELVQKAHINIVPSFQMGKTHKLLHSLFEGRHCITNDIAVLNTDLAQVCHIANDCRSKISMIKKLINVPFTNPEIEHRKKILLPQYSNQKNVSLLLNWLYE